MNKTANDCYVIAGKVIAAQMMGEPIDTLTIDNENPLGFNLTFKVPKTINWDLDSNDEVARLANKRFLLIKTALFCGATKGFEFYQLDLNAEKIRAELAANEAELRECYNNYCEWADEKRVNGADLYNYFARIFQNEFKAVKVRNALHTLTAYLSYDAEEKVTGAELRILLNRQICFQYFEMFTPPIYPEWSCCFE